MKLSEEPVLIPATVGVPDLAELLTGIWKKLFIKNQRGYKKEIALKMLSYDNLNPEHLHIIGSIISAGFVNFTKNITK